MSETTHTPGPWHAKQRRSRIEIWSASGVLITTLEAAASNDAPIIVAAPVLYAALKAVEWGGTSTHVATGRESQCCPECGNLCHEGHAADCQLAAALASATRTEGEPNRD